MKTFVTALAACGLVLVAQSFAQDTTKKESAAANPAPATVTFDAPGPGSDPLVPHLSTGIVTPTPEMWFYQEEMRQYLDSRLAVRRNAETRDAQRRERLAAMKWYGMSNARPYCSADPFNGPSYSPQWSSGSPNYPMRWSVTPRPWVVVGTGYGWWR